MKPTDYILIAIACFCAYAAIQPDAAADLLDKAQAKIAITFHK